MEGEGRNGPLCRDIRRCYCEYCGICRSTKALIASHICSTHQEEIKEKVSEADMKIKGNVCDECGASFRKPAYLKQHTQSHSLERPFDCPLDDCNSSYRRQDHLTRHLLQHEGKFFACSVDNCNLKFVLQGNMKRHVKQIHEESRPSEPKIQKQYACQEIGCGKVFEFASKLQKHKDCHVKLDSVESL